LWEEEPLPPPETTFTEQPISAFGWNTTSTKPINFIKKEIARVLQEDKVEIETVDDKIFLCRLNEKNVFFEVEVANLPRFSVSIHNASIGLFPSLSLSLPSFLFYLLVSLFSFFFFVYLESAWYPFEENSRKHVGLYKLCKRIRIQTASMKVRMKKTNCIE
jgi:hypothetical protein